jgi:hypothetical protein
VIDENYICVMIVQTKADLKIIYLFNNNLVDYNIGCERQLFCQKYTWWKITVIFICIWAVFSFNPRGRGYSDFFVVAIVTNRIMKKKKKQKRKKKYVTLSKSLVLW